MLPQQFTFIGCLFFTSTSHSRSEKDVSSQSHQSGTKRGFAGMLHFFFVTGILAIVGSRVASLVVLEFSLRAISGWVTAGPVRSQLCD